MPGQRLWQAYTNECSTQLDLHKLCKHPTPQRGTTMRYAAIARAENWCVVEMEGHLRARGKWTAYLHPYCRRREALCTSVKGRVVQLSALH